MRYALPPLALLALLAACGGTGAWGTDAFCPESRRVDCEWLERCDRLGADGTVEGCIAEETTACEADFGPIGEAVDAGRLAYDGAKAKACLETHLSQRSCLQMPGVQMAFKAAVEADPDCSFLTGQVPLGGACYDTGANECADGYCGGGTCPGECVAYPGLGEPCLFADGQVPCGPDAQCTYEGVCRPRRAEGEACSNSLAADRCERGLVCKTTLTSGDGVCGTLAADGSACAGDADCESWLCIEGTCISDAPAGTRCQIWLQCADGLVCRDDDEDDATPDRCAAPVEAGGACDWPWDCAGGLGCVEQKDGTATCEVLPGAGEACLDGQCASGAICGDGLTCTRLGGEGDPCTRDLYCDAGLVCSMDGTCRSPGRPGDACGAPDECFSGECVDGACAVGACLPQ